MSPAGHGGGHHGGHHGGGPHGGPHGGHHGGGPHGGGHPHIRPPPGHHPSGHSHPPPHIGHPVRGAAHGPSHGGPPIHHHPNHIYYTEGFIPQLEFVCEQCGEKITVKSVADVMECVICGKKMCKSCYMFGLCPTDYARLSHEEQDELILIEHAAHEKANKFKVILTSILILWTILGSVMGIYAIIDYSFTSIFLFFLITGLVMLLVFSQYGSYLSNTPQVTKGTKIQFLEKYFYREDFTTEKAPLSDINSEKKQSDHLKDTSGFNPNQDNETDAKTKICPCGYINPITNRFCERCGYEFEDY